MPLHTYLPHHLTIIHWYTDTEGTLCCIERTKSTVVLLAFTSTTVNSQLYVYYMTCGVGVSLLQARVVEAIRIMNELRKTPGTDQQKFITEVSDQAKDNPLLPNLLNIAKRAGVTGLEEGECVEWGREREREALYSPAVLPQHTAAFPPCTIYCINFPLYRC